MIKKLCLLIDDDLDDQEIFMLALESLSPDLHCTTACSGYEALLRLNPEARRTPDYIFLDLNMPRMNGKECLAEIKKLPHLQHVPVIIYSTSCSQKDMADTRELGATDFITKPHSVTELSETLRTFFRNQNDGIPMVILG